jgi:hypothetical protein
MRYVRFECAAPNIRGLNLGVFAAANGLAQAGRLSKSDWLYWREANDWFDRAYPDPGKADPSLFDRRRPVECWFKTSATHLLERVPAHLELLDRYAVAWRRLDSDDPGRNVYEDDVQVVVERYRTGTARQ